MRPRPILLVSKCLGFDACRYNGQILRNGFVDKLKSHANVRVVCPEVEIGLGTPREPVRLLTSERMIQPGTGSDLTRKMVRFSRDYVGTLGVIDGAILKGRSPSCAVKDAKRYHHATTGAARSKGPGLFARAVVERFPDAAIEDDGRLENFRIREHFLTKLFTGARFRALTTQPSARRLVRFQAENKLLFMAYNQTEMRAMGRLVADVKSRGLERTLADYRIHLSRAFSRLSRVGAHVNVLMHALGYFSKELGAKEKAHFLELLEGYRDGRLPLSTAVAVLRSWVARFDEPYLAHQTYFAPYPDDLVAITDSGKGREGRL